MQCIHVYTIIFRFWMTQLGVFEQPLFTPAMDYWIGLLCAASAAIAFGVQYAPVPGLWRIGDVGSTILLAAILSII